MSSNTQLRSVLHNKLFPESCQATPDFSKIALQDKQSPNALATCLDLWHSGFTPAPLMPCRIHPRRRDIQTTPTIDNIFSWYLNEEKTKPTGVAVRLGVDLCAIQLTGRDGLASWCQLREEVKARHTRFLKHGDLAKGGSLFLIYKLRPGVEVPTKRNFKPGLSFLGSNSWMPMFPTMRDGHVFENVKSSPQPIHFVPQRLLTLIMPKRLRLSNVYKIVTAKRDSANLAVASA